MGTVRTTANTTDKRVPDLRQTSAWHKRVGRELTGNELGDGWVMQWGYARGTYREHIRGGGGVLGNTLGTHSATHGVIHECARKGKVAHIERTGRGK